MRLLNRVEKLLFYLVGILFLLIFVINVIQIAIRATTGSSWLWVLDFSQFTFVWVVMLGTAVALSRNDHLVIAYIKEMFPTKIEITVDIFSRLMLIALYLVLIVTGIEIATIRMSIAYVSLGWPSGWAYMALPVSGVFMVIFALPSLCKSVRQLFAKDVEQMTLSK